MSQPRVQVLSAASIQVTQGTSIASSEKKSHLQHVSQVQQTASKDTKLPAHPKLPTIPVSLLAPIANRLDRLIRTGKIAEGETIMKQLEVGTVEEALDSYKYAIAHLSPKTQREYIYKLRVFAKWCGGEGIGLVDIKATVVRRFLESVKARDSVHKGTLVSSLTLKGYTVVLKTFLGWLSREDDYEDMVSEKLASRIAIPRVEQTVIETFSSEQIKALQVACESEYNQELRARDRAIIDVLIDTGIRASELVTLLLDNVTLSVNSD